MIDQTIAQNELVNSKNRTDVQNDTELITIRAFVKNAILYKIDTFIQYMEETLTAHEKRKILDKFDLLSKTWDELLDLITDRRTDLRIHEACREIFGTHNKYYQVVLSRTAEYVFNVKACSSTAARNWVEEHIDTIIKDIPEEFDVNIEMDIQAVQEGDSCLRVQYEV